MRLSHIAKHITSSKWQSITLAALFLWLTAGSVLAQSPVAQPSGVVYAVMDNGDLKWNRHDGRGDGSSKWATPTGKVVGTEWVHSADSHQVGGRFELTTSPTALRFVFEVRPIPRLRPVVRRLGATPRHDSVTLDVRTESSGRYAVLLRELSPSEEAQLQIEVRDDADGWFELHRADFALRPLVPNQAVAAPGFDGNFVVHSAKAPAVLTLLIGTTELPLDGLPPAVSEKDVLATYTVDFLPSTPLNSGWVLSVGTHGDARSLFYRSSATRSWEAREAVHLSDHAVLTASMPGPGSWLLVRGVPR